MLDSDRKLQNKNKEGDIVETVFKIRAADQAEEEKDYIRLTSLVKFISEELNMTRKMDLLRLKDLFEVILIKG